MEPENYAFTQNACTLAVFAAGRRPGCRPRAKGARQGFTLIELLVVIAILAMLFSLLLPSLRRAKYRAQVAACKSNLRQIASGLNIYAADHDGLYPKNGCSRQYGNVLRDGNRYNIETVIKPYFGDSLEVMGCPLTVPRMPDGTAPWGSGSISYSLLFDTWSGNNQGGSIARGPNRVYQYDLSGNVIADENSWSAMRTWWWPYLDESGLMRRVGQTWTLGNGPRKFRVLACDRVEPRGHPTRGVVSNHPDPSENWQEYNGANGVLAWVSKHRVSESGILTVPAADGNFAATDGSVRHFQKRPTRYWPPEPNLPWTGVGSVGIVPNYLEQ